MGEIVTWAVLVGVFELDESPSFLFLLIYLLSTLFFSLSHLLILYVFITATVKRLHDTDRSGWWVLITFIPVIGFFYLIIVCGFFKGTVGENRYGSPFRY
jgi:uncharacterized membrane protein YhaH (DUF805 family)